MIKTEKMVTRVIYFSNSEQRKRETNFIIHKLKLENFRVETKILHLFLLQTLN